MGRKRLSYLDAVKLLGGDSPVIAALGKLAGVALSIASAGGSNLALNMFGLRDEVERLGQGVEVTLRKRFRKLDRFKRSELLEAAHAVLVVSAFFAALDDLSEDLRTALDTTSLELTKAEQAALAAGPGPAPGSAGLAELVHVFTAPGTVPGLGAGWSDQGCDLKVYYAGLARRVRDFAAGTAVWDRRDETTRSRWSTSIFDELPKRALVRYEERLGQLASEFPEFAFWAHRVGVQTVLDQLYAARRDDAELGQQLRTLAGLMQSMTWGAKASQVRSDLVTRYREQLDQPIAGVAASSIPDDVRLPYLRDLYVNPSYRTLHPPRASGDAEWVSETGWQGARPGDDLWALVLEHLLSPEAASVPLMLLGQPGAGKSVFTQMLAAELEPRDYLVVRVELRTVPSDAKPQQQIERALELLTGRTLPWPDLADERGDAQPVILLDGFDELLQATQVSHFDFLEQVQDFQDREASLGRPVAVLVTSRTAVADQVRYPPGTVVVRLEEFDDGQVRSWLDTWNRENPGHPLPAETALAQGELARQPLLLFLLALFHSGGGALAPGISQAHLYQRLFTGFAERDVAKTCPELSDAERRREVQRRLDLLSMFAFAMFNRGRQTVAEADLAGDLDALKVGEQPAAEPGGRKATLKITEQMAGRFFFRLFIQRDQAMRGQSATLSTYEFLHASFGEFLVGRWVVDELSRLAEQARRTVGDLYPQPPDDGLLRALLSVAVLSSREQRVLDFVAELLVGLEPTELADQRALLTKLFRGCLRSHRSDPRPEYRPVAQTAPAAYAVYSANLVLVLILIAEAETARKVSRDGLTVTELYRDTAARGPEERLVRFYSVTRLWHSQLTAHEWNSLLDVIRLDSPAPVGAANPGAVPELRIIRWRPADFRQPLGGRGLLPGLGSPSAPAPDSQIRLADPAGRAVREATLLGTRGYQEACAALQPYLGILGTDSGAGRLQLGDRAADMLALLTAPAWDMPPKQREHLYVRLADAGLGLRQARLLLSRLRDDRHRLPPRKLAHIAARTRSFAWTNITAYLDVVAYLHVETGLGLPEQLRVQLPSAGEDWPDLMSPRELLRVPGVGDPADMAFDIRDPRDQDELTNLFSLQSSDLPGVPRFAPLDLPGLWLRRNLREFLILSDVLGLKGLRVLNDLITRPTLIFWRRKNAVVEIVLWAEMAQRGLPVPPPRPLPDSEQVKYLRVIVPDYVASIRRLATERGYPDPFPHDPLRDTPTPDPPDDPAASAPTAGTA